MAKQNNSVLQETKGNFKFIGIVENLDRQNAYSTGVTRAGKDYRRIAFSIRTSPNNSLRVELFQQQPDNVYLYDTKNRKTVKKPYKNWEKNVDTWEKQNLQIIGLNIRLGEKDDGVLRIPQWDATQYLYDNLTNGDSVVVTGNTSFSTSTGNDGRKTTYKNFIINNVYKTSSPVDFGDENFKEVNDFQQQFVLVDTMEVEDSDDVDVFTYIIDYNGNYTSVPFVIHTKDSKTMEKLAKAYSRLEFGTTIVAHGKVHNRAVEEQVEPLDDGDEMMLALMGDDDPMETITTYINELEIRGTAKSTKKRQNIEIGKYDESDFTDEDDTDIFATVDEDDLDEDFLGEESDDDFDSDELPFDM